MLFYTKDLITWPPPPRAKPQSSAVVEVSVVLTSEGRACKRAQDAVKCILALDDHCDCESRQAAHDNAAALADEFEDTHRKYCDLLRRVVYHTGAAREEAIRELVGDWRPGEPI